MTIQEMLSQGCAVLEGISDSPHLDAQWLLLEVLGKTEASWLYAHSDEVPTTTDMRRYQHLVAERATGKPLAYILGWWEFYGRRFIVNEHVLIPRPTTEALVDATLEYLRSSTLRHMEASRRPIAIADIGTGSGIIAITLACELSSFGFRPPAGGSDFEFLATDISPAALSVARRNAQLHSVSDKIEFLHGDMLEPLAGRHIDLIVSNPPYLPAETLVKAGCARDTKGLLFEPRSALDGGPDGQRLVRKIAQHGIPAIVETQAGAIRSFNENAPARTPEHARFSH